MPAKTSKAMLRQASRARKDFLQIESEIGLSFTGIALAANDKNKRKRTTQTARNVYDTIMRLKKDIDLSDAEKAKLDRNLLQLKRELQSLGESF